MIFSVPFSLDLGSVGSVGPYGGPWSRFLSSPPCVGPVYGFSGSLGAPSGAVEGTGLRDSFGGVTGAGDPHGPCLPTFTPVLSEFKIPDTPGTQGSFCVHLKGKLTTCLSHQAFLSPHPHALCSEFSYRTFQMIFTLEALENTVGLATSTSGLIRPSQQYSEVQLATSEGSQRFR